MIIALTIYVFISGFVYGCIFEIEDKFAKHLATFSLSIIWPLFILWGVIFAPKEKEQW